MASAGMTDRNTRARRLEAAGYVALKGWVPRAYGERVMQEVDRHAEDVARVADEPMPAGRPARRAG